MIILNPKIGIAYLTFRIRMICGWNEKNSFLAIGDMHAPLRTMRVRARNSPWITSELKKLMHDRDILKLKAVKSNDPSVQFICHFCYFKLQNKYILNYRRHEIIESTKGKHKARFPI